MIVIATIFPLLTMECDRCRFLAAISAKGLHVLDGQEPRTPPPDDRPF